MANEKQQSVMSLDDLESSEDGIQRDVVEAWGGVVQLASISAGEVFDWITHRERDAHQAGLMLVARSLTGPDGERLCKTDADTKRCIDALKKKDSKTFNLLVERIMALNGLSGGAEAVEAAKNDSGQQVH